MWRKFVFSATLLLLVYLVSEGLIALSLVVLKHVRGIESDPVTYTISSRHRRILTWFVKQETVYQVFDARLGWSIKSNGAYRNLYRANRYGFRGSSEIDLAADSGRIRIAAFGDSFTHCDDVPDNAAWPYRLEHYGDRWECLNFGVGGYGPDQAYLRYQGFSPQLRADIVLIGFMSENIYRTVNVYRPFYYAKTGLPLAKPRFILAGDGLELIPNPFSKPTDYLGFLDDPEAYLSKLEEHDYFYHGRSGGRFAFLPSVRLASILRGRASKEAILRNDQYNVNSEAYQVTSRVLESFYRDVEDNGAVPVVLLFPNKGDIRGAWRSEEAVYTPLIENFVRRNIRYIDLQHAFDMYVDQPDIVDKLARGHYSIAGNDVVARYLAFHLGTPGFDRRGAGQPRLPTAADHTHKGDTVSPVFAAGADIEAEASFAMNAEPTTAKRLGIEPATESVDDEADGVRYLDNGRIVFRIHVQSPGIYHLQARVRNRSGAAVVAYVTVEPESPDAWSIPAAEQWEWVTSDRSWGLVEGYYTVAAIFAGPLSLDTIRLVDLERDAVGQRSR